MAKRDPRDLLGSEWAIYTDFGVFPASAAPQVTTAFREAPKRKNGSLDRRYKASKLYEMELANFSKKVLCEIEHGRLQPEPVGARNG